MTVLATAVVISPSAGSLSLAEASTPNGRIALVRWGADGRDIGEIYVMNDDGTAQRNLTRDPGDDEDPSWSPDGQKIAFVSQRGGPNGYGTNVWVVNADGGAPRKLTHTHWSDRSVWSPDGQRIAFIRHFENPPGNPTGNTTPEIYVMNADGSNQQRLTRNKLEEFALDWSRSGQLAFVRGPNLGPGTTGDEIFVMNPDGSGLQRLTRNRMQEDAVAWSPDGQEIAFVRWRTSSDIRTGRSSSIFVMNADGSSERRLTPPARWNEVPYPVWSPDGEKIAFQWGAHWDIYVMNADGSGRRKVVRGRRPTWSPDGGRIAFTGGRAIYVVNSDGSGQHRLVPRPGRPLSWRRVNGSPVWSPTR